MRIRSRVVAAVAAGVAATTGLAGAAQAAPRVTVVYSSSGDLPTDFAVSHGSIAFLVCGEELTEVAADGGHGVLPGPGCYPSVEPGGGVAYSPDGRSTARVFAVHIPVGGPGGPGYSTDTYSIVDVEGATTIRGGLGSTEKDSNPDGAVRYGTASANACVRDGLGPDASYTGRVLSRPSAVAAGADRWYVADRAGNTVYRLHDAVDASVLALLPPVKVTVSRTLAARLDWPSCVVGTTVAFEAAPTDVEVAPDGTVYAAGLPTLASGKHADRSVIYRINPKSGKVTRLSQRYDGPVDLAVGTRGRLFVARPDASRISVIKKGRSSTYVRLARVLSVETDEKGHLYAAQGASLGADPRDGAVVKIS